MNPEDPRLDDDIRRDLAASIDQAVWKLAQQRSDAIDKVCMMALTGGEFGVAVYEDVAMVDPRVPYGRLFYYRCRFEDRFQEARWLDRVDARLEGREPASFTCPVCAMTSYSPQDVSAGYCGYCHDWTGLG